MPTYIVKVNKEAVDLYNQLNPRYPALRPNLNGAIIFKVCLKNNNVDACYTPYLSIRQTKRLKDSLEESQLSKINQIRLSNLLEE